MVSLGLMISFGLVACAKIDTIKIATELGYSSQTAHGTIFDHQLFWKEGAGKILHIYIEGDGKPFATPISISRDPSPKQPLMLNLMALDDRPSLYLGRPCYFQLRDQNCNYHWWTDSRYSSEIVASMNAVINQFASQYSGVRLIGHSGGGTLAWLIARSRNDVLDLITLAGNLDTRAWAIKHNYSPLNESLNPAALPPLPTTIEQHHYLGDQDQIIDQEALQAVVKQQTNASLTLLKDTDHVCCWQSFWPQVLQQFE